MGFDSCAVAVATLLWKYCVVGLCNTCNDCEDVICSPKVSARSVIWSFSGKGVAVVAVEFVELFGLPTDEAGFLNFSAAPFVKCTIAVYGLNYVLLCVGNDR